MKSHASMNRIYRLVWNQVLNAWVAVAETAKGRGKGSSRKLIAAALSLSTIAALAGPQGGQVVSGAGAISQSGNTTTINQASQNLSLSWQSFNVAKPETVNFVQPSASAIAVNRIQDTNASQILGHLNANGQVYLINPNGILFGQGAQVNVGALVASTLDVSDTSLTGNSRTFSGNGTGSVINQGTINAGYVALLGNHVSNQGVITAQLGTVALGAGSAATLTFNGNSLVKMQIDQSTLNNLVENGGLIRADGGMVIMNAGAKDALLASVVNNSGVIEARTVENHEGSIILLGGMTAGTVHVGGTLDASAPTGGNGGFIETSAAHVKVADSAKITTQASNGLDGTWLIDPADFTIGSTAAGTVTTGTPSGDISGATLSTALGLGAVTILSTQGSTLAGSGNINVNDTVTWSANKLTLNALNNININAAMNGSGSASLALLYGQASAAGGTSTYNVNAAVNLPAGNNFSTQLGTSGTPVNYTVITSLGAEGDATTAPATMTLQGMSKLPSGNYVLGANIDATGTSTWNANAGFTPIGNFTGIFDGLGHAISGLTINTPSGDYVGLFANTVVTSVIRNVGLVGGSVSGASNVGGLIGKSQSTVSNSYATGTVTGTRNFVGGLVGFNNGTISNSYATGKVSGASGGGNVGGLVGLNGDRYSGNTISNSYATGSVSGANAVGGLVGDNNTGNTISTSYATGSVTGGTGGSFGGLTGYNFGTVSNSYWNTTTSGQATSSGGTGLTTAQMQTLASFAGFIPSTTPGAAGNAWVMVDVNGTLNNAGFYPTLGATYPMLASEYSTTINNAHQLQLMAMNLGASYTLGSNISALGTGTTLNASTTTSSTTVIAPTANLLVGASISGAGIPAGATISSITDATHLVISAAATATGSSVTLQATGNDVWGSAGFVPVGNLTTNFTGTFDGLGHTINGLTINAPLTDGVGLFGAGSTTSVISNVGMEGGSVSGRTDVGGLVGYDLSTISNSYATGSVTGTGSQVGGLVGLTAGGTISNSYATGSVTGTGGNVGGLAGYNSSSTISNSYATGSVTGTNLKVGGLVGYNTGTISNSYATGSVTSTNNNVGGLVGYNNSGTISNSYATGSVTGQSFAGGLVGSNSGVSGAIGTISNSYATGSVTAQSYVGGLVGSNDRGGNTISNSYATGSVTAQSYVGGLVGLNTGTVSNSFYNSDSNTGLPGLGGYSGGVTVTDVAGTVWGMSTLAMQNQANFTGPTGTGVTTDHSGNGNSNPSWDFTTPVWRINPSANNGNPCLAGAAGCVAPPATTIYLDLLTGTSVYGSTPSFTYGYYTSATYGSGTLITDANPSGTRAWSGAPTSSSNVDSYSVSYLSGITLGNSAYKLAAGDTVSWSVTPATLTVSGTSVANKIYNGNTTAGLSGGTLLGMVNGDGSNLTLTQAGTFASKNAGTGIAVTAADTLSGTAAGNYTLTQPTDLFADITRASLSISGITAGNKVYDATTAATLTGTAAVTALGTDQVTLGGTGSGAFADKNVGTGKAVTISGYTLGGADASNYLVVIPTSLVADITPLKDPGTPPTPTPEPTPTPTPTPTPVPGTTPTPTPSPVAGTTPTPVVSTPPAPVLNATTQLALNVLSPQVGNRPDMLSLSPTITVTQRASLDKGDANTDANSSTTPSVNVAMNIGSNGPALQIISGGMRLPANLVNVNE